MEDGVGGGKMREDEGRGSRGEGSSGGDCERRNGGRGRGGVEAWGEEAWTSKVHLLLGGKWKLVATKEGLENYA